MALFSESQNRPDWSKECPGIASKLVDHLFRIVGQPGVPFQVRRNRSLAPVLKLQGQTYQEALKSIDLCLQLSPNTFRGKHAEALEQVAFNSLISGVALREEAIQLVGRLYLASKDKKSSISAWTSVLERLLANSEQVVQDLTSTFLDGKHQILVPRRV